MAAGLVHASHDSRATAEERNIRVEDFLNDKLQTAADLDNIDALLNDVKIQRTLLQQQVRS